MREVRLGEVVASIKNGIYKPASEYAYDGMPCLRMYNIDAGSIVWRDIKRMRINDREFTEYGLHVWIRWRLLRRQSQPTWRASNPSGRRWRNWAPRSLTKSGKRCPRTWLSDSTTTCIQATRPSDAGRLRGRELLDRALQSQGPIARHRRWRRPARDRRSLKQFVEAGWLQKNEHRRGTRYRWPSRVSADLFGAGNGRAPDSEHSAARSEQIESGSEHLGSEPWCSCGHATRTRSAPRRSLARPSTGQTESSRSSLQGECEMSCPCEEGR